MRLILLLLSGLSLLSSDSFCQEDPIDTTVINAIRREGFDRSQVMEIAFQLTDVSGPRLTNSPGYLRAANYAMKAFETWGLKNIYRDSFYFGKAWSLERSYLAMKTPYYRPLYGFPKAWTNGTKGLISAPAFLVKANSANDLQKYKGKLKGKILLLDIESKYEPTFRPDSHRFSDEELKVMETAVAEIKPRRKNVLQLPPAFKSSVYSDGSPGSALKRFALVEGAAGIFTHDPNGHDGTITAGGQRGLQGLVNQAVPEFAISREDYSSTVRLLRSGIPVSYDLDLRVRNDTGSPYAFNVIAEIEGEDPLLKQEVVMLGAHLDSWQAGTGATDNGCGVAVVMEAVRIIKSLNLHPKRTMRIALWSGEEQGLIGSYQYVRKTFYDSTGKQARAHKQFSAYYNLDYGGGKIRGIYLQNIESARPVFKSWLTMFKDLGASTVTIAEAGSTDTDSFERYGLPGFQFIQDPLDYWTRTHHTHVDTYDHLVPDDLKTNAVIMASIVYLTAMREEKIPR